MFKLECFCFLAALDKAHFMWTLDSGTRSVGRFEGVSVVNRKSHRPWPHLHYSLYPSRDGQWREEASIFHSAAADHSLSTSTDESLAHGRLQCTHRTWFAFCRGRHSWTRNQQSFLWWALFIMLDLLGGPLITTHRTGLITLQFLWLSEGEWLIAGWTSAWDNAGKLQPFEIIGQRYMCAFLLDGLSNALQAMP